MRDTGRSSSVALAYLAGNLAALALVAIVIVFCGYRLGFPVLFNTFRKVIKPSEDVLYMPEPILKELIDLHAVVDNAGNPTAQLSHYTILVTSDSRLGWKLIPDTRISLYMLRALNPLNFDPPVLALETNARMSAGLSKYLDQQARVRYQYSVRRDGFRTTLPAVNVKEKILMVGDSVLFGEGVNDDQTMASRLQVLVGTNYQVINGGVGGYAGEQAFEMARRESEREGHAALVYVACQNDFMNRAGVSYLDQARELLKSFAALKRAFSERVVVLLTPYMEYVLDDVLLKDGWWREMVAETDKLRRGLPTVCAPLDLECRDLTDMFLDYTRQTGSAFARFGLYVDDAHLSPFGNQRAAEAIYSALRHIGAVGLDESAGIP
ncbi:MAG TPA: SGNH/GDSL hydrolase family protein [Vicinamibacterales bacterium]|nr:SGNH/GDSL hydrolase family protein [Vicinamibacterales bacterium]